MTTRQRQHEFNPNYRVILCRCDNCGHECDTQELDWIKDIEQRLDYPMGHAMCIEPAGECPECGCLSYEVDNADNKAAQAERDAYEKFKAKS